ncbi:hypothetical protein BT93_L2659 [Corymbia citriodora subsp. variegata]|uniref:PGG domain-containing protein n=1 Tax=Corymbia citriodora subsp. variegata TaxID=360336 RepID=A0A8T0CXD4_CORYI|nr:hypothetical protein BT93_L2659 [Corymbia citriodora subsp. variegata]
MWRERRQRLEALVRDNQSQQQQDPAQTIKIMDHQLYLAAKEGDVNKFITALEDYCPKVGETLPIVLERRSPSKDTLLHVAAESDDIVRAIIDFVPGHLFTAINSREETPLIIAARAGKTNAVELLLPQGLPRFADQSGNSALHEAVRNRHCEVIRRLVSADPYPLYFQNRENKSPWCLAVETGDLEVLRCLLEATDENESSHRLDSAGKFGMSPVYVAMTHQKIDMLAEMWDKKQWLFQLIDEDYETPLHFAAYINYFDGVQFSMAKFPICGLLQDKTNGHLPIHVACMMDHVRIVEKLLGGWPANPEEFLSKQQQNILHVSARYGSISTVKYILKNPKCDHLINARDLDLNTPLHLAALHWQPSVLLLLARDKRVDLKLVNVNNMTALDIRLTRIVLASAGTPRSGELFICKPTSRSKGRELEPPELDRLREEVNTRMVVAALVAAMTFASGFSVPGGYNGSDPNAGIAILLHKAMYNVFVISNSIAMYSSIIALVILLWTHINDPHAVRYALLKARFPLLVTLVAMPLAFMAGVYVTITKLAWLAIVVLLLGSVALFIILGFYLLLYIPLGSSNPLVRRFTDLGVGLQDMLLHLLVALVMITSAST